MGFSLSGLAQALEADDQGDRRGEECDRDRQKDEIHLISFQSQVLLPTASPRSPRIPAGHPCTSPRGRGRSRRSRREPGSASTPSATLSRHSCLEVWVASCQNFVKRKAVRLN